MKGKVCALMLACSVLLPIAGCGNAANNTAAGGFVGGVGSAVGQGMNTVGNATTGWRNGGNHSRVGDVGTFVNQRHTVQVDAAHKAIVLRYQNVGRTATLAGTNQHISHVTVPVGWTIRVEGTGTKAGTNQAGNTNIVVVTQRAAAAAGLTWNGQTVIGQNAAGAGVTGAGTVTGTRGGVTAPGSTAFNGGTPGHGFTGGAAGGTAAGFAGGTRAGGGTGVGGATTSGPTNALVTGTHVLHATKAGQYAVVVTGRNQAPQMLSTITVSKTAKLPSITAQGNRG
ncbi:hypothetical protein [Alicyclobacillus acidoterrestris]|uniref:Uncharacterized protein n=1 Tax=Alicyclobacillus acidoterrestris (strain ATCC 49025 / DSM 3922 / CIP 106132 / NCIMB 13137 / GD3B) TaxID=1356854 RepID=T0CJ69_ALIAG|nr:hypothetical protein [Alicyclobacillus acidoterrestris]EPZ52884.1 hypothetical protein N007_19020 [Alicyclobacillus acidoterrestris ATCC 49025]UNO50132.1 hypothetical protein K1I37_06530 [Alicyclobacillus acidoterrestris]